MDSSYTLKQVKRTLERYHELRSTAGVGISRFEQIRASGITNYQNMEEIICMLADIDRAVITLTSRQRAIVELVKTGYSPTLISRKLNISKSTFKGHFGAAISRITAYLNSIKCVDKDRVIL